MRRMMQALTLVMAWWAGAARGGLVGDFADILFWSGSGPKRAALVLDFGTAAPSAAPPAVAWGYRWDATANLDDMIFALTGSISGSGVPAPVAGSDPRLAIDATYYTSLASYFIRSFTYDQVGLPAGWSQAVRSLTNDFDNDRGIAQYEAAAAGGVWPTGGMLLVSPAGPADTELTDGGWYGYVVAQYDPANFFTYPATYAFAQPTAAAPEPSAWVLVAIGVSGLSVTRRRRRVATLDLRCPWPDVARNPP